MIKSYNAKDNRTIIQDKDTYKPVSIEGSLIRVDFIDTNQPDETPAENLVLDVYIRNDKHQWQPIENTSTRTQVDPSTNIHEMTDLLLVAYDAYASLVKEYPCDVTLTSLVAELSNLGADTE